MTVLVSYQPRPIPLGPFCHTRIPVEDQKDGGVYKRDWSVISYLIPDKDKLLIRATESCSDFQNCTEKWGTVSSLKTS